MEKYNKFLFYANKTFSYVVLVVCVIGLIVGVKSGDSIGGGALGVLIVGIWTVAGFFKIPQTNAEDIMVGFMSFVLILSGLNLINRANIYFRILGFLTVGVGFLYLGNLIFEWGY